MVDLTHFTYADLAEKISKMTELQKNTDVAVYSQEDDEYHCVEGIGFCDDGVLEDGDPFIIYPLNSDMEAMGLDCYIPKVD